MSRLGKIGLGVLAAFLLLLFWLIPLGALRGDQAEVDLAEQEADQAESEAQAAINANASAANELEVAASTEHMRRFASYLPEIEVERPRGVHRWYEQHIMTPAELQAYNGGTSNESVEATEPTYYSNNPTCYGETADGGASFSIASCSDQPNPTVVLGRSDVEISLTGWRGDCRAALGWIFSRFFETLTNAQGNRPSGYHLKPWILPGSFDASVPQCLLPQQIEALRREIGVVYGEWPVDDQQGEADLETGQVSSGSPVERRESLSVSVRFTLLFRPAHSRLCVSDLAGYGEASDESSVEAPPACPAAAAIADRDAQRRARDTDLIPSRLCLPRLPIATAIPDGDVVIAAFDPLEHPPASMDDWPLNLASCSTGARDE